MKEKMRISLHIGILLLFLLSACAGNTASGEAEPSEEESADQAQPAVMSTVVGITYEEYIADEQMESGELTFEEHRSSVPPAPVNLNINPEGNGVQIVWEPPDAVEIEHGYGDEVLYYKVLRRAEGKTRYYILGTTTELYFLDANRSAQDPFYYSVVAVFSGQEGGELDGDRSEEIFWGE